MESKSPTHNDFLENRSQTPEWIASLLDTPPESDKGEPPKDKVSTPQTKKRKGSPFSGDSPSAWFFIMLVFTHQNM